MEDSGLLRFRDGSGAEDERMEQCFHNEKLPLYKQISAMEDSGLMCFGDDSAAEDETMEQDFGYEELPVYKQLQNFNRWIREDTIGKTWELWYTGKSKPKSGRAGMGLLLRQPDGGIAKTVSRCIGTASATEAEYKALITGLVEALRRNGKRLVAHGENELITQQVNGNVTLGSRNLIPLFATVVELAKRFKSLEIVHVPLEENGKANRLAMKALRLGR